MSNSLWAQTYNLNIVRVSNASNTLTIKVQASLSSTENMGSANLVFTYDNGEIHTPVLGTIHNFSGGSYSTMTMTTLGTTNTVSLNIEFTGADGGGTALATGSSFTDVAEISFTTNDETGTANFQWQEDGSTTKTVFYQDDNATRLTAGTLTNNNMSLDATAPTVSSVSVPSNDTYTSGQNLDFTVNFNENVTANTTGGTPQLGITVGSTARQAVLNSGSGTQNLVFRYTVQSGEVDTDGVAVGSLSANGGTLQDAAGNDATLTLNSIGSTSSVLVDAVAPTVSSVSVPSNDTYISGQNLDFTVNFNENVTANTAGGTPQLAITVGSTTRQAVLNSGSGTQNLVFRYTVQSGEVDSDGVAVGSLSANGGTLKDAAGNDATLTLNSIASTTSVLVDAVVPTVSSVSVPANDTYVSGENLDFTVNFSKNVTANTAGGTPQLAITLGSTTRQAVLNSGSGTQNLVFRYTIQSGEVDTDGVAVGSLSANGGTLQDAAGNDATLTLNSVGATTSVLVDAVVPTVSSVSVPANDTYVSGENLDFTVNFNENVTANTAGGTPQLAITIGSTTRQAVLNSGSGTQNLVFRYTVQSGEVDTDGVAVGSLSANGGTLKDAAGNDATLTLNSVAATTSVLVDAVVPTVSSVSVPTNDSYVSGEHLDFTVNFNENVTANTAGGTPQLAITVGSTTRQAVLNSGSGTQNLVFRYTVQSGEVDADGVAVGSLSANGGTLKDAAGNDATLTLNSVGSTTSVLVDAIAPTVSSVSVPANATYGPTQNLDFTVNFSENVTVNTAGGTPQIAITVGSTTRQAVYNSGSGTQNLVFRYTVQVGDSDSDGVAVGALAANGGTLRDAAGNDANVTLNSIGVTTGVLVSSGPTFSTSNTQSVAEGNTTVVTLAATGTGSITYSLIGGDDQADFSLATDALSFAATPDFESPADDNTDNDYSVQVRATDDNGSTDLTITVSVTDENDNTPVISTSATQSVAEGNTAVVTMAATDADAGASITFSKIGGADEALFTLTGAALSFTNAPDFESPGDANTNNEYIVQVQASDGVNTSNITITVTVTDENDNTPVISTSATQSVAEGNTAVVTMAATDGDAGASITFSKIGGADEALFTLTGADLSFTNTPDFESPGDNDTNNEYIVQVQASDGVNTSDITITVTVTDENDNTPVISTSATQSVAENTTAVVTLAATDGDAGASITFSKIGGADEALFTLTGADLSFTSAPDFESPGDNDTNNEYIVQVQASDGVNTSDITITVTVTDENDNTPVISTSATQSVAENTTAVVTLAATDGDAGASITFSKIGGADEALFTLTGADLSFTNAPDFESPGDNDTNNEYIVQVQASDGVNTSDITITVTVTDENDNAPVFSTSATQNVAENITAVVTLAATDGDAGASITFSKIGGADEALFTLTGADLSFTSAPDFESPGDNDTNNEYIVQIQASDGTNTTPFTITVTVTDENDNSPVFSTSNALNVAENTTAVATLVATDGDAGASITYSKIGGADEALFTLTGADLSFTNAPDFESPGDADTNNQYIVQVQASDGVNTSDITITVTVTDANDNAPVISTSATQSVAENTTDVVTLAATDGDAGASITFSKIGGADEALFTLTGADLSFTNAPNFESPGDNDTNNEYIVQVQASDGSNTTPLTITVTVTDVNDNSPVFSTSATQSVAENTTAVVTLAATDGDAGSSITYSIIGGDDQALFGLATDALSFSTAPDFETPIDANTDNDYIVQVRATDGTNNTDLTITVTVTDVDDTAPVNPIVTTPAEATTVNAATATISGTHTENGVTVHAYADANNDGTADNTNSLGNSTVSGGNWSFSVNLTGDSDNNFVVSATDGAGNVSGDVDVPTITEDSQNPTFVSSTPTDDDIDVGITDNITITFNEDIALGTGNITLVDITGAGTNTIIIDAASPGSQASVSGAVLTIDPTNALALNNNYAVQIAATAIDDLAGNSYAGITDNTTLNFTTINTSVAFDATASSNGESTNSANLAVSLNAASVVTVTVDYAVTGTATGGGTDYTLANGTLTFNPSETTKNITMASIVDDALNEENETVIVTLSNPSNAGLGTNTIHTYTINDDDPEPTVMLSQSNATFSETSGTNTITATSSAASGKGDITVTIAIKAGGTATETDDFTLSSTTITITQGMTTGTAIISAVGDALDEPNEDITIEITGVTNGAEDGTQEVTSSITDDDATPTIGFNTTSSQGPESTSSANLQVDLSAVSGQDVSVDYTVSGTATGGGDDYTLMNGTLTINAGGSLDNITIASIVANALDEDDETVIVTLSNPVNATLGTNTVHTYTIQDDDATPTITFTSAANAGAESVSSADVTVDLSTASGRTVTADYAVTGTATEGTDFTLVDGTLTFAAGDVQETITIASIVDDAILETNETVVITLSNLQNVDAGTNQVHTYTINNNDAAAVTIEDVSGAENAGDITVTATLDKAVEGGFTIEVNTADGTAETGDSDYTAVTSQQLTFTGTAGETQTFTVTPTADTKLEANEDLTVSMTNLGATSVSVDITDDATVTINNDDAATVTIADVSQAENGGDMTFTATLDVAVQGGFTVEVNTSDNTATNADSDYTAVTSKTLTFTGTAGETQQFTVTPTADTKVEANETFEVSMANLQATSLTVNISDVATGTITNDDAATLAIDDVTMNEGASGTTTYTFTATLTGTIDESFTVDYATADNTATTADSDYTATSGTLNFSGGTSGETQTFSVSVASDAKVELDEDFTATLSNVQANGKNLTIATATGTGTITNDDAATISIDDVTKLENADGGATTDYTFTVTLGAAVDAAFTVDYATADGTATTAGSDYTAASGTLNFAGTAGETQTITVTVANDDIVEADEDFTVDLSNLQVSGRSVTVADATGTGTITNDDVITITIGDMSGNEDGGPITLTATLDKAVDQAFDVTVASADATATAGSDYTAVSQTLSFAGTAGEAKTFTLTPTADAILEADETVTISMTGTTLTKTNDITDQATVTITNDDAASLAINNVTLAEGNTGTTAFTFDVTLTGAVDQQITVDYVTADNTATTADSDYTAASGTLSFNGTDGKVQQITVNVTGDMTEEPDEDFTVTLSNIVDGSKGVTLSTATGTGSITNEDDNTAPTGFTVTWDDTQINAAEAGSASFTFAGAEVGTTYNYSITSAGGGTAVTGTGTIATATDNITPIDVSTLNDGALTLSVTLTDDFANTSTAQTDQADLDTTAPTGTSVETITTDTGEANDDETTSDNTLVFAGLAEAGATVEVFIDGTSIGTTTATNTGDWTFDHTGTTLADGTYAITAKATDTFGNEGALSSALSVTVDTGIPSAAVSTSASSLVNGTFSITVNYSESVSDFELADVSLGNANGGNFQPIVAGVSWTLDVTPQNDGTVTVTIPAGSATDASGNANTESNTLTVTFDGTVPEVTSITRADANPTIAQEVDFTVVFSEGVNNVDASDFEVAPRDGIMNPSVVSVTQNTASNYTVRVDRGTGEGFYGLNLKDDDSITDDAGNSLGGNGMGNGDFTGEEYQTNSSPTDISISASSIVENNALNDVIGMFTSTDADAVDTFEYELVAGNGDDDNGSFGIVLDELIATEMFDFETKTEYNIRVQTMDNKGGTFEKAFTITVTDANEEPTTILLSNNDVDEADDPGLLVGTMTTEGDPDADEMFTYSLVTGDGDANNLLFTFNGDELRTNDATNFEETTTLSIRVRSTDSGGLFTEEMFTITINNVENEPLRDFDKDQADARVKNFFTPNGDGDNDTWVIEDILDNPINEVKVYSQAGKLIFSQRNYENDWDGTFGGEPIPPGTYYYEINIYNGESIIRGFLTIIRN